MDELKSSIEKGVQKIVFNRPMKRNAFTRSMYERLTDILNSTATDDNVLVTVLTGEGDFYSSGNDLAGSAAFEENLTENYFENSANILRRLIAAFINHPKILIALVNGPAIGIAATTLGLCDVVIASDKAYFTTPFVKLGLTAEGCSSVTFPRIFGPRKAAEMLYFNYKMSAKEAEQCRFVTKVVPHSELNSMWEVIYKYAMLPHESLLSIKRLVRDADRQSLHAANEAECKELVNRFQSEEFVNAIHLFITKPSKL